MKKIINILLLLVSLFIITNCDTRDYQELNLQESTEKVIGIPSKDSLNSEISPSDTSIITHTALIKTSMGDILIGLYGKESPETVANFIGLAKMNYYNGILFHRVAKNFLIQTGDRNTLYQSKKNEWGFGGESFYGGEIEDEINPNTPSYKEGYKKGFVAMANKGPNTNTSQFFICLEQAKKLKHKWTIFGKVIKGMKVVENISHTPVEISPRGADDGIPIKAIRIYSVNINLVK